ncbi:DUF523 domain-containing protein [Bacillus solimangrovi]|uniref:Uncharacterized protein n=1 Tax=Bacillus solimangrovi TaxID=1305675 RepID=A0A1E5LKJ7_9BACI|nr:DUF523 domain-containing protein [Bacillus solimangrovi]OEH94548.1 hypothetical protein BFG57_07725 [Bacillus solimangrovi]
MLLVSACLAGLKVRYDGGDCLHHTIEQLVSQNKATTVCPEVLGGLPTPRIPAEIIGGDGEDVLNGKAKVIDKSGNDVTDAFLQGAYQTLEIARELNVTHVILKENSPSCGSGMIYDGQFQGVKKVGKGVTAALLERNGMIVATDENIDDIIEYIEKQ